MTFKDPRTENGRSCGYGLSPGLLFLLSLMLLLNVFLSSCAVRTEAAGSEEGKEFEGVQDSPGSPQRVAALSGSLAQVWLLAGGELAGVTDDALEGRDLGLPEDTVILGTVKEPNSEEILDLAPDYVILSADIQGHQKIAGILDQAGIANDSFHVESFQEYLMMLKTFTQMTGRSDLYDRNGTGVGEQIQRVISAVKVQEGEAKTALFLRAYSTGVSAKGREHTVCTILDDLGVKNIAASNASLLEDLSLEKILLEDPDYIFVVPMGSDEEKAMESLAKTFTESPAWGKLTAVKEGNFVILPKDLFHYKPNQRWGEAYEYLGKILYPEVF